MRQTLQLILYVAVATVLTAGCTGKRSQTAKESDRQPQPTDTLYTAKKARGHGDRHLTRTTHKNHERYERKASPSGLAPVAC